MSALFAGAPVKDRLLFCTLITVKLSVALSLGPPPLLRPPVPRSRTLSRRSGVFRLPLVQLYATLKYGFTFVSFNRVLVWTFILLL